METWTELLEEAKRRAILVAIVAVSLAYAMSLTSSSVWINLPIAIIVLAALRRVSFAIEIRWKAPLVEHSVPRLPHLQRRQLSSNDPLLSEASRMAANRWRHSFDSPAVEAAVDEFTKSLIDEWVTNLWYSSITPDQEVPEELRILVNGVIAEVAQRAKRVNLITLLSKDVVDLVGTHFDLYRRMKAKIGPDIIGSLSTEERDEKLKHAMMSSRELHPALVSPEAEYKVLKRLAGGVVSLVLKRQDAQCRLLRAMGRELLACVVLRPVINLMSPGFINELIENMALASKEKSRLAAEAAAEAARIRIPERVLQRKPSVSGLEMTALGKSGLEIVPYQKNVGRPFASVGDVGTPVESKLFKETASDDAVEWGDLPRGDWAQVLDAVTQRRAQALTPEHLDNLWTKGRNYKKRESEKAAAQSKKDNAGKNIPATSVTKTPISTPTGADSSAKISDFADNMLTSIVPVSSALPIGKERSSASEQYKALLFGDSKDGDEGIPGIGFSPAKSFTQNLDMPDKTQLTPSRKALEFVKSRSDEDLQTFNKNNHAIAENTRHDFNDHKDLAKSDTGPQNFQRPPRRLSHRRSRSMGGELREWQESGGTEEGFLTLLNAGEGPLSEDTSTNNQKQKKRAEPTSTRAQSSILATVSTPQMLSTLLKCRVMGAHFEKSGSKSFAVYTIKVTDADHRSWRVQRRYRNFEQLHRRLKDVPYYTLNLPPKRFLSSNLDTTFVRERCILLDKYLKDLLAIPSVAELHEVWDFFSVNSQHYSFGTSPSMMKTLAVNVDDAMDDMFRQIRGVSDDISGALKLATSGIRQRFPLGSGDIGQAAATSSTQLDRTLTTESSTSQLTGPLTTLVIPDNDFGEKLLSNSMLEEEYEGNYSIYTEDTAQRMGSVEWHSDSEAAGDSHEANPLKAAAHIFASQSDMKDNRWFGRRLEKALSDGHSPVDSFASDMIEDELVIPQEWSPPKVTVPLLNLVDQIFQLQGRGWIRRQVLWIAKQILQLGMGDAFDDWLIARIQWLRREEVVASGIYWLKGVLWPDGIFITKHPRNITPTSSTALEDFEIEFPSENQDQGQQRPPMNSFEQRREAARQAGVVREIILDKAPATLVSLIGKNQYTRCAKDIYYFSQATVCMKQLAFSLLEMLLLATFPELHDLVLDVRSSVM
ncbi:hypothetical protein KC19_2G064000 [Ceratodon purpureus]|uniref:Uncharacterized protein n=1 Tax=Ceratodon purpureus TaxID=3225 RepID=A0A8T0ITV5_CERPU|nr:hypothetical protein KC19_2G064000 [Ceratodon purpureus]